MLSKRISALLLLSAICLSSVYIVMRGGFFQRRPAEEGVTLSQAADDFVGNNFPFGEQLHHVTVMTVEPGFGGQKLQEWPLKKVRTLKAHFPNLLIEVDGGINLENAHIVREAGTDVLIAGTAVFTAKDPEQAIQQLRGEPV